MKASCILLTVFILISSCTGLPEIIIDENRSEPSIASLSCLDLFPEGKWQLMHNIQTITPDGRKGHLVGVIVLSSSPRNLKCVLMTIEGFVLFDAELDNGIKINRGVPPFNTDAFAKGIIDDIQLIFLRPLGTLKNSGHLENGSRICRYQMPDDSIIDAIIHSKKKWEINRYTKNGKRIRSIQASNIRHESGNAEHHLPKSLNLIAHGLFGYELNMELVEAIPLE